MGTATWIRELETSKDSPVVRAALYKVDPPMTQRQYHFNLDTYESEQVLQSSEYVRVSASNVSGPLAKMFGNEDRPETYIFLANDQGDVLNWMECEGSFQGALDHVEALENAGYTVENMPLKESTGNLTNLQRRQLAVITTELSRIHALMMPLPHTLMENTRRKADRELMAATLISVRLQISALQEDLEEILQKGS